MGAVAGQAGPFAAVVALFLSTQVVTADWLAARLLSPRPATTMGHFMAIDVAVAMGLFITAFLASSALF
jgi:hypothetical protein